MKAIISKRIIAVFLLCFLSFSMSGHYGVKDVHAQEANKQAQKPENWVVRCKDKKFLTVEDKRGKCEIFQRLTMQETGQRVVEMAIGFPDDKPNAHGMFILPMGILVQLGVKMIVDENKPLKFNVRYCLPNGCYAYVSLNEDVLNILRQGNVANIEVFRMNGQKITIPVSLKGITKALSQIN